MQFLLQNAVFVANVVFLRCLSQLRLGRIGKERKKCRKKLNPEMLTCLLAYSIKLFIYTMYKMCTKRGAEDSCTNV